MLNKVNDTQLKKTGWLEGVRHLRERRHPVLHESPSKLRRREPEPLLNITPEQKNGSAQRFFTGSSGECGQKNDGKA
jgi:hypothetical protein